MTLHRDGIEVELGTAEVEWSRTAIHVRAELSLVDNLNDHERTKQTVDHRQVRYGDVPHVSITWEYGTTAELQRGNGSGGAGIDAEVVDAMSEPARTKVRRIVTLADRWHLNTMVGGCVHQGETWTCTRGRKTDAIGVISEGCGTVNGWPIVREVYGERPYPKRGDQCHVCGRNRWDEPTDRCPETGYRFGTSWLVEVPPADVIAELRALFTE